MVVSDSVNKLTENDNLITRLVKHAVSANRNFDTPKVDFDQVPIKNSVRHEQGALNEIRDLLPSPLNILMNFLFPALVGELKM